MHPLKRVLSIQVVYFWKSFSYFIWIYASVQLTST